jgi:hypothetical protein
MTYLSTPFNIQLKYNIAICSLLTKEQWLPTASIASEALLPQIIPYAKCLAFLLI